MKQTNAGRDLPLLLLVCCCKLVQLLSETRFAAATTQLRSYDPHTQLRPELPGGNTRKQRELLLYYRYCTTDNTPPHCIAYYTQTDQKSKLGSRRGAGYDITTNNNKTMIHEAPYRLPEYSPVYAAEHIAIREACNLLL